AARGGAGRGAGRDLRPLRVPGRLDDPRHGRAAAVGPGGRPRADPRAARRSGGARAAPAGGLRRAAGPARRGAAGLRRRAGVPSVRGARPRRGRRAGERAAGPRRGARLRLRRSGGVGARGGLHRPAPAARGGGRPGAHAAPGDDGRERRHLCGRAAAPTRLGVLRPLSGPLRAGDAHLDARGGGAAPGRVAGPAARAPRPRAPPAGAGGRRGRVRPGADRRPGDLRGWPAAGGRHGPRRGERGAGARRRRADPRPAGPRPPARSLTPPPGRGGPPRGPAAGQPRERAHGRLLTWPLGARFTLRGVGQGGWRAGEVVSRSGVTRKALRLYEAMGILPPPSRTEAGYRVYDGAVLPLLRFVTQARQLGFSLAEIREITGIRRAGRPPCPHVRELVRRKLTALDRMLRELGATRRALRAMLATWPSRKGRGAAVCQHIEERRCASWNIGRSRSAPRVEPAPRWTSARTRSGSARPVISPSSRKRSGTRWSS